MQCNTNRELQMTSTYFSGDRDTTKYLRILDWWISWKGFKMI